MAHAEEDDALPGQDSFIDVVCNMVGILIVLVMIVGVRASSADSPPSKLQRAALQSGGRPTEAQAPNAELEAESSSALDAKRELDEAVGRIADLTVQRAAIEARREQLSLVRAAIEQDIQQRRSKLNEEGQRQFDVQRQIAEIEIKLNLLTQEQVSLMSQAAEVKELECVPTPIAKTVDEGSIHARLKHGNLALVPADELIDEIKRRGSDYLRNGLNARNHAQDVFGPIDGFRMRFSVHKSDETPRGATPALGPDPSTIELRCVFMPMADDIGQPVEQALLPDSLFMAALRAKPSSVTLWVYPDSFEDLRGIKQAMWDAGIPLAVRPLGPTQPITFSTEGTRSVAQ